LKVNRHTYDRLRSASEAYHHAISKKKDFSALDQGKDKLLPIDALGIVMRNHGEEFGDDSIFGKLFVSSTDNYTHTQWLAGTSLAKLGEAHSKVGVLQETFALTLQDTFLA
jgi:hypothetical protein